MPRTVKLSGAFPTSEQTAKLLRVSHARLARLKELVDLSSSQTTAGSIEQQLAELEISLKPLLRLKKSGLLDLRSKVRLNAHLERREQLKRELKARQ